MADTTTTTPAATPAPAPITAAQLAAATKPGTDTTEAFYTKVIVIGGMLLGLLGTVGQFLGLFATVLPGNQWVGLLTAVVGVSAAAIQGAVYNVQRSNLKQTVVTAAAAQTVVPVSPSAAATMLDNAK